MSAINFERWDDAITYAVENPKRFDMFDWFRQGDCGTTACLAGTVAVQAGYAPKFDNHWDSSSVVTAPGSEGRLCVSEVARLLLGFDDEQADEAFCEAQTIADVIAIRNRWAREAGVPERTWDTPDGAR